MLGKVSSTFQDLDCDETLLITTLYRLMLKSYYQKKKCPLIGEHVAVDVVAQ